MLDAGYRIDRITAVDMFPQTHHVETVVRLTRVD
jgi:tRNA/tmRNA/rRNA uracil-C5-methylase (TrmA/RlmC/RlmD family)